MKLRQTAAALIMTLLMVMTAGTAFADDVDISDGATHVYTSTDVGKITVSGSGTVAKFNNGDSVDHVKVTGEVTAQNGGNIELLTSSNDVTSSVYAGK